MILIIITILWAYCTTYFTIHLYQSLTEVKSLINAGYFAAIDLASNENSLSVMEDDIESVGLLLAEIKGNLRILNIISWPIIPFIEVATFLPGVGPYASQVGPILQFATNIARAGDISYSTLSSLVELTRADTTTSDFLQQVYLILEENQSSIIQASLSLDRASLARQDIDPSLLPHDFESFLYRIDEHFEVIRQTLHFLAVIPDLLGTVERPRTYLLLAQNKDEMRATGGFISGIGIMKIAAGDLINFEINDSYQVDDYSKGYPAPPEPLQRIMLADYWVPRDANWSPDFPTTARKAQELYALSTDQATDGVIAFDQTAVATFVDILGSLYLPDFSEPITAENIEIMMQQAWSTSPDEGVSQEWWEHRKDFMSQLGEALLDKLLNTRDKHVLFQLASELHSAVKDGHLLVYFNQEKAQAALTRANLDNGIDTGVGDFLFIVDSNIGFNKTDAVVQRNATYFVDLTNPQTVPAMLIVQYTHTIEQDVACIHEPVYGSGAYTDMLARCYWNYWRVYTGPETQLYYANETPVSAEWLLNGEDWAGQATIYSGENHTQTSSGLFVLPAGQKQDVVLQFILPSRVIRRLSDNNLYYNLRIQKQPGLSHLPFVLQVNPPRGYELVNPESDWAIDRYSGFWVWSGEITNTQDFELIFSPIEQ